MWWQIPGVPVVHALRNALLIKQPSALQQHSAKSAEEARSHMTDIEYKMLNIKKKRKLSDEDAVDASNASEEEEGHGLEVQNIKASVKRTRSDIKDKVQFKRKKAKVGLVNYNSSSALIIWSCDISFCFI